MAQCLKNDENLKRHASRFTGGGDFPDLLSCSKLKLRQHFYNNKTSCVAILVVNSFIAFIL